MGIARDVHLIRFFDSIWIKLCFHVCAFELNPSQEVKIFFFNSYIHFYVFMQIQIGHDSYPKSTDFCTKRWTSWDPHTELIFFLYKSIITVRRQPWGDNRMASADVTLFNCVLAKMFPIEQSDAIPAPRRSRSRSRATRGKDFKRHQAMTEATNTRSTLTQWIEMFTLDAGFESLG